MGREKRIAESRGKQVQEEIRRPGGTPPGAPTVAGPSAVLPAPKARTGVGKAIVEILALYLIPILVIILIGKVFLHQ